MYISSSSNRVLISNSNSINTIRIVTMTLKHLKESGPQASAVKIEPAIPFLGIKCAPPLNASHSFRLSVNHIWTERCYQQSPINGIQVGSTNLHWTRLKLEPKSHCSHFYFLLLCSFLWQGMMWNITTMILRYLQHCWPQVSAVKVEPAITPLLMCITVW